MLSELQIENVAVIEKAEVRFAEGLNVLTGETGAGKSILIDSINAILGNRTSRDIVRTGTERAVIWASFEEVGPAVRSRLEELGYECDGSLVLNREISVDGRSQCRVNGRPAPAAVVRDICANLINIHGQHDNQELLNPDRHIYVLDAFAGCGGELAAYGELFSRLGRLHGQIQKLSVDESEKERRLDLLRYQVEEIESADLSPGEDERLIAQRDLIRNSEKLLGALNSVSALLSGGDDNAAAIDMVYEASESLSSVGQMSQELSGASERLNDCYYSLRDVADEVKSYLESFDYDPSTLQSIEERLDLIYRLRRKYGSTVNDILEYLQKSRAELQAIEGSDETLARLLAEQEKLLGEVKKQAELLSAKRRAAFRVFEQRIMEELKYLNMPGVAFSVKCEGGKLHRLGRDIIEFYISTNPGEPPKPLAKIASGGELSRIMLAIKNALADKDSVDTLIFDEIDTGVSGVAAQRIGTKLRQSAKSRQTLCVTHSAPIACCADNHLYISKEVREGRTFTSITSLDFEARKHEIARIISGDAVTETSLLNAEEMMRAALEA